MPIDNCGYEETKKYPNVNFNSFFNQDFFNQNLVEFKKNLAAKSHEEHIQVSLSGILTQQNIPIIMNAIRNAKNVSAMILTSSVEFIDRGGFFAWFDNTCSCIFVNKLTHLSTIKSLTVQSKLLPVNFYKYLQRMLQDNEGSLEEIRLQFENQAAILHFLFSGLQANRTLKTFEARRMVLYQCDAQELQLMLSMNDSLKNLQLPFLIFSYYSDTPANGREQMVQDIGKSFCEGLRHNRGLRQVNFHHINFYSDPNRREFYTLLLNVLADSRIVEIETSYPYNPCSQEDMDFACKFYLMHKKVCKYKPEKDNLYALFGCKTFTQNSLFDPRLMSLLGEFTGENCRLEEKDNGLTCDG